MSDKPIIKLLRFVEENKYRREKYSNHLDFPDNQLEQAIKKVELLYARYEKERDLRRRLAKDVVKLRGIRK